METVVPQATLPPRWVLLVAGLAAVWLLVLAGLAGFTADRVTLNRDQIRRADYLVTGTIRDRREGLLAVEKHWKRNGAPSSDVVRLENLAETDARTNRSYLVPISRLPGGRFRVTGTALPNNTPLVYPLTDETLRQLRELPSEWLRADIDHARME